MVDYEAEIRIKIDDSTTSDIYHQGNTTNENERTKAHAEVFTLAASGEYDLNLSSFSEINDIAIFSNTTSSITLTVASSSSMEIPFLEHFSLQSGEVEDIVIKNTSSVTGTYKAFLSGE